MRKQFQILILIELFTLFCYGQDFLSVAFTDKNNKIIISDRKSSDIDTIAFFKPITEIKGVNQKYDSLLSLISQQNLAKEIDEIFPQRIAIFDFDVDSEYQARYNNNLFTIAVDLDNKKKEHSSSYINHIIESMERLHINYALAIIQIGSSAHGETIHPTAKFSTGLGKSLNSYSHIYCLIFDREKKNIALFAKSSYEHFEPCVKKNTDEQLINIFKKYFKPQ